MASRLTGAWDQLLREIDPRRFLPLLQRNVEIANRATGADLRDQVKERIRDQEGMKPLHPFTVHRRVTRKFDAQARGGDRAARAVQSRQPRPLRGKRKRGVIRPRNPSRPWRGGTSHKRLLDHGAGGLSGAITFGVDGLSFVVGVKYLRGEVDIGRIQEFGAVIRVTPKMRGWLHAHGLHLKPSTTKIEIPATHFMGRGLKGGEALAVERWDGAVEATLRAATYRPK